MSCRTCGRELDPTPTCPHCGAPADAGEPAAGEAPPSPWSPEPTLAFASPQEYAATHPASAQPGGYAPAPAWTTATPRKKRRLVPILLLALALVVGGGGVAAAGYWFGWIGGGRRPAEVLPASAAAYVQLDLSPSLAQGAAAWQFLRDLPEVRAATAAGTPDPKAILWQALSDAGIAPDDLDYATDLKPWLGDRLGLAVVPKGARAVPMTVVQVTDEATAANTLRRWASTTGAGFDVTMRDGFALLTPTEETGYLLAELGRGTLGRDREFSGDLAVLGDTGVLAAWADLGASAKLSDSAAQAALTGRSVAALRFSADTLRVEGRVLGIPEGALADPVDLGDLPDTTLGALGFSGGEAGLEKAVPSLDPDDWLGGSGLAIDDLAALLGRSFTGAISGRGFGARAGEAFEYGLRVVSDDPARAQSVLDSLSGSGTGIDLQSRVEGDTLIAASTGRYLGELAGGGATLGGSDAFTKALPDHARTSMAGYVALEPLLTDLAWVSEEYRPFVGSLRSVGVGFVDEDHGTGSWAFRLVRQ